MTYPNFSQTDFDTCSPPCKLSDMNELFMDRLQEARTISGIPFILNSAYRLLEHELAQGRKGTSSHTKGVAVDIAYKSGSECWKIVEALLFAGFTRIGIAKSFIHVDYDQDKPKEVMWGY